MICIAVCALNEEDGFAKLAPIPTNKIVECLHNSTNNVALVSVVRSYVNLEIRDENPLT